MIEILKLSNNIPVLYEYMTDRKSTALGIFIKMGSALEHSENNGVSHFIEHMMFKGTKHHSAKELADIMSDLGSDINAYTSKESTAFYGRVLNEDLSLTIKILGEMLLESSFDEKDIAKEKNVILDEINLYDDSPEDLCHELLQKHVWKNSPYGFIISGPKGNVKGFKKKAVTDVWESSYVAENTVISVAGGGSKEVVLEELEKVFGKMQHGSEHTYETPVYEKCFFSKFKDTEQLHINIALDHVSAADDDRYALSMINAYLGGNLNSRLFQKVREELGLTYSIYSYSSMFQHAGLFHIYASTNPEQAKKVLQSVYDVMNTLLEEQMTLEEVQTIKRQMRTELVLSEESSSARMNANARSFMELGYVEDLDETVKRIEAVTWEEIKRCITTYMNVKECSISLVGKTTQADVKELKKCWETGQFKEA